MEGLLYGRQVVQTALQHRLRKIQLLLVYDDRSTGTGREAVAGIVATAQERSVPVQWSTRVELDRLCPGRPHQNVVLRTEARPLARIETLPAPQPASLWLALHQTLDPQVPVCLLTAA
jgi:tRNA G18 (ribose-2'-O)-methylase SpoU